MKKNLSYFLCTALAVGLAASLTAQTTETPISGSAKNPTANVGKQAFAPGYPQYQPPAAVSDAIDAPQHIIVKANEVVWKEGPPALPSGAKMAVLEGDPKREGIFTIRLKFPSNYRIKPHWHPAVERATIISGTLYFGHGEKVEKVVAGKSYDAETGSFSLMPERKVHYAWTGPSGAVIQVTGVGPWTVNYVDPADDPRNQGKNQ